MRTRAELDAEAAVWGAYPNYDDIARFEYGRMMWRRPAMRARLLAHWTDPRHPHCERFAERRALLERVLSSTEPAVIVDARLRESETSLRCVAREIPPVFGSFFFTNRIRGKMQSSSFIKRTCGFGGIVVALAMAIPAIADEEKRLSLDELIANVSKLVSADDYQGQGLQRESFNLLRALPTYSIEDEDKIVTALQGLRSSTDGNLSSDALMTSPVLAKGKFRPATCRRWEQQHPHPIYRRRRAGGRVNGGE